MNAGRRGVGIGLTAAMALFGAAIQAHSHGEAGRGAVDEWVAKAGPEAKALLDGRR